MWRGRKIRGACSALLGVAMSCSLATIASGASAHAAVVQPAGRAVTVTPSKNLVEGQQIMLSASGLTPQSPAIVAQCTVGTVDPSTCDVADFVDAFTTAGGKASTPYTAHLGFVSGAGAIIDCRTIACEMLVVDLGVASGPVLTAAPITFNPHGPTTTLTVTPSAQVLDGQTVHFHGTGFTHTAGLIAVLECVTANEAGTCRLLDNTGPVLPAANGTFDADLSVARVLHDQQGIRTDCASTPCEIFAVDVSAVIFSARAGIAFDASVPPPPAPALTVAPNTQLPFSKSVAANGSHWTAFDTIFVQECGALATDPCDEFTTSLAQADPNGGFAMPFTARRVITDPVSGARIDCTSAAGRCNVLAFDPATGDTVQAPVSFDPNAPIPNPPVMHASDTSNLADRQPIRLSVKRLTPGTAIEVDLCAATEHGSGCLGAAESGGSSPVGADGIFSTTIVTHRFFATGLAPVAGRAQARLHAAAKVAATTRNPFIRARALGFDAPVAFRWAARAGTVLDCAARNVHCSMQFVSANDEFIASVPIVVNAHKTPLPRATLTVTQPLHLKSRQSVTFDATGVGFLGAAAECAMDGKGGILGCAELLELTPDAAAHVHRSVVVRRFLVSFDTGAPIDCRHAQCAIVVQPGLGSNDLLSAHLNFS